MRWFLSAAVGVTAFGFAARPAAFPDGPPPARTGGFGEPTCQVCHQGAGLNVWGDGLLLEGRPKVYVPGQTYPLTVRLARSGMGRGGFQVAVRFIDGAQAGGQAGALVPRDSTTRISQLPNRPVQYLGHTRAPAVPDSMSWIFDWTAPASGGAVVFNLAANAANNDDSELGDHIYIREYLVSRKR